MPQRDYTTHAMPPLAVPHVATSRPMCVLLLVRSQLCAHDQRCGKAGVCSRQTQADHHLKGRAMYTQEGSIWPNAGSQPAEEPGVPAPPG